MAQEMDRPRPRKRLGDMRRYGEVHEERWGEMERDGEVGAHVSS